MSRFKEILLFVRNVGAFLGATRIAIFTLHHCLRGPSGHTIAA